MVEFARKFNYYEPSVGVSGRLHCSECIHTLDGSVRHYGVIKTCIPYDPNYGKLCLYCKLQGAFVKPFAWCDKIEGSKMLGVGGCDVKSRGIPDEGNR